MNSKKLLWFNPVLLLPHARQSDRLFWRNILTGEPVAEMKPRNRSMEWHMAFRRVTKMNNLLNDGTGLSKQYGDGLVLARIPANDGKVSIDLARGQEIDGNFAEFVEQRACEALMAANEVGAKIIYLSYSGGSDSVLILSAMLQNKQGIEMLRSGQMVILTNRHAQREDPKLWQRLLDIGVTMQAIDYDSLVKDDGDWMMITGDGECYGTMFVNLAKDYVPQENMCITGWDHLARMFLDRDFTGLAWDYFKQLMAVAPFKVETIHQAWWWFEQCVDRQDDFMRLNAFSSRSNIRMDCIGHAPRVFQFFSGQDFFNHTAYNVLGDRQPRSPLMIKKRSDECSSRFLNLGEIKHRPKFYSQDRIIRCVHKQRIFDDYSWDSIPSLEGFY